MSIVRPESEHRRRQALVDSLLLEGFAPPGVESPKGAALHQALIRGGKNLHHWAAGQTKLAEAGQPNFAPNWSLYDPNRTVSGLSAPLVIDTRPSASAPLQPMQPEYAPAAAEPQQSPQELPHDNDNDSDDVPAPTPREHASIRARVLSAEINELVTRSRYPVINPEAIIIDAHIEMRYDRKTLSYEPRESKSRTWLSETLRVDPVRNPAGKVYLFTAAQNDALLNVAFWNNLLAYAKWLGAELVVGPFTYETQWWSENNPLSRSYDPRLASRLCFGQMALGDNFVFCGEMNTLPTASQPIGDLVTYSRNRWAVFPHAKRQLKSVPSTDPTVQAHQVMTTGCVTFPKVVPRKAGVKSLFHQIQGATLVEFDSEGRVFCRQITADKAGAFYDLDRRVSEGAVSVGHRVRAMVCGDVHVRKLDPTNALATFGFETAGLGLRYRDNMLDVLRPEHVLLHDVFDNEARNHHHVNDNAYSYEMAYRGRDDVQAEVLQAGEFLANVASPDRSVIVVESNHDIALDRYVREGRYRNDGINVRFGLQLEDAYLQHRQDAADALDTGRSPPSFSLLEHAIRTAGVNLEGVSWAYDGESRLIDDIEVGHHGFRGANGAKGTISGFARMGRKVTIGDKHSPEINEGVYCAGAMALRMGYNKGPSGWAVSHVLQYADGSRSIITLQGGRWRAEKPRVSVTAATALPVPVAAAA